MKKLALIAVCTLAGFSSYAQGVINGFNGFTPVGGSSIAYVRNIDGSLLPTTGRAEVLTADGLTVLSTVKDGTGNALAAAGLFSLGTMQIPGSTIGSPASVLLRVWDSTSGSTFATALVSASTVVTFPTVGGSTAPSNFVTGSNFTGIQVAVIPEPSTVALAALGVAGLFFVARRKN